MTDATSTKPATAVPRSRVRTLAEARRTFVRHGSPRFLLATSGGALVALAVVGDWRPAQLLVVLAVVATQPFAEWLIHVYVLHARPVTVAGRTFDSDQARKHRAHHASPRDLEILFIPRSGHIGGGLIVATVCLALPDAATRAALIAAVTLSGLFYEWIHFLIHTDYKPKTAVYRRLYTGHRLHHYRNEKYWFGVSRRFGDTVLRTDPAKDDVPLSATCLALPG